MKLRPCRLIRWIGARRAGWGGLPRVCSVRWLQCFKSSLGHSSRLNSPPKRARIQRLGAAAQTGFADVGCRPVQCFVPSCAAALSGRSVCGAAQRLAPPQCACAASESTSPRHRHSTTPIVMALLAILAAKPIEPLAAGAAAAGARRGGCCGAESRSAWPAESLWARRVAAAATGSPRRSGCGWRACRAWHLGTGR